MPKARYDSKRIHGGGGLLDTYDCDKISHLFAINSFHVRTIKVSIAI